MYIFWYICTKYMQGCFQTCIPYRTLLKPYRSFWWIITMQMQHKYEYFLFESWLNWIHITMFGSSELFSKSVQWACLGVSFTLTNWNKGQLQLPASIFIYHIETVLWYFATLILYLHCSVIYIWLIILDRKSILKIR